MRTVEAFELATGIASPVLGSVSYFYLVHASYSSGVPWSEGSPSIFLCLVMFLPQMLPSSLVGLGAYYDVKWKDNTGLILLIVGNVFLLGSLLNFWFLIYMIFGSPFYVVGLLGPIILAPITLFFRYLKRADGTRNLK
jgi:hypothetical protein